MKKKLDADLTLAEVICKALLFLPKEQSCLVGVSGGIDSVALLHMLLETGYHNLIVVHFNHQLRGADSDKDTLFVKNLAEKLRLPFELGTEDVQARALRTKLSLETAAREARYEFFGAVAHKHALKTLLLAHHADDQVETCFFNFLRGTASAGLAGMLPCSERILNNKLLTIVRPLLSLSKETLKKYLEQKSISFRHDATNDSPVPTRNRLRHQLFPLLDTLIGPTYREAILRTATILAAEDDYLEKQAAPWADKKTLDIGEMTTLPLALQRRVVHAWLQAHGFSEVGFAEVERVLSLLKPQNAHQINLPGRRHAYRCDGKIEVT
ncbi:MAG: tRNA lysidine(34) synthetase TilS [Chthoniobacterales bacterium]